MWAWLLNLLGQGGASAAGGTSLGASAGAGGSVLGTVASGAGGASSLSQTYPMLSINLPTQSLASQVAPNATMLGNSIVGGSTAGMKTSLGNMAKGGAGQMIMSKLGQGNQPTQQVQLPQAQQQNTSYRRQEYQTDDPILKRMYNNLNPQSMRTKSWQ